MKRFLFWLRWSARDLRDRWILVAAIAATIAIGTGAYASLESLTSWRKEANTRSLAMLRAHDVRLYLADGSFATPVQLQGLVDGIPHAGSVIGVETRLVLPTRVDASTGDQTIVVPGRLVGVATSDSSVDALQIRNGRDLTAADDGQPVAELEYHFALHYGLWAPGSVKVGDDFRLDVVGAAMSSDWFMVVTPNGDIMAEANYAVIFVPLQTAGQLTGHPGMANELVLRLSDPSLAGVVRDELQAAAAASLPDLGATGIASGDELIRRWVERDAEGDQAFFAMFAWLMLAGATFAAFNLTTRIVESQRRQIGIGLALGLPARTLAIRPLAVAAEIAVLGVAFGIVVGILVGIGLREMMTSVLPMPVFDTPFKPEIFARAAVIGFILPFAASVYPVWRAVRARPVDAIRTGYLAARRPGLARYARALPLPTWLRHPLSNVLRTPRRTFLTALGVAAAVAALVGVIGMLDMMSVATDRGQAEIVGGSPDRIAVDLTAPLPADQVRSELASVQGSGRVDLVLRLPASASSVDSKHGPIDLQLDVLDLRDNAWHATLAQGRLPSGPGEMLLAEQAAEDLNLKLGNELILRHPVRVSETAVTLVETRVVMVGIHPGPMRTTAYMDVSGASLFAMAGSANRATVVPAAGTDEDALRRALFDLPGVVSVQPIDSLVQSMRDLIAMFFEILGVVAVIALILAVLVAYNSATISQDERTREVATMLAFGLPARRVMGSAMVESAIVGVVGTVIGIAGGFAVLAWLAYGVFPATMPDFGLDPAVSLQTLATAVGLGIVAVALAPALTWRRLTRMNLPAKLRVVE
jgi:putative ABC transport system permease protein